MEVSDEFRKKLGLVFAELAKVGTFLREKGYYDRAIEVFLTLSKDDSTFEAGSYAYELGLCYEHKRDYVRAKEYFAIAVRENPAVPHYREAAARFGIALPPDPTSDA